MSLTTRVLLALVAGVGAGLALGAFEPVIARGVISAVEPVGTLFINAIRMTVIPLVASSLVVGMASSRDRVSVARIGLRGLAVFVLLLAASGVFAALIAPSVFARITVDSAAVATLRSGAASGAASIAASGTAVQSPTQWLVALVPSNPVRAAVDGAMLPLILFSMMFGLALLSIAGDRRTRVTNVFRAITESMIVVVRWLLVLAPIGVFALALPLVARIGVSAVGALVTYIALVSILAVVFTLLVVYPAAIVGGRVSLRVFARAVAPAQLVASSSRSSIAALPALIEAARDRLHLSEEVTGFFIPLANATFRVGATLALTTGTLFIARLYGVSVGGTQLATIVTTSIITSFSIPGIPGGSIIAIVPVLASVGLPIEGLGILLGVDTIPDIFRTTANVTGQMAAATIVARGAREPAADPVGQAPVAVAAAIPASAIADD